MTINPLMLRSFAMLFLLIGLFLVPWQDSIRGPAVLKGNYTTFYAPAAGKVTTFGHADNRGVKAGDVLLRLVSPQLDFEIAQAERRIRELEWRRTALGFDARLLDRALVTVSDLQAEKRRLASLLDKRERLTLRAPTDGRIVDIPPDLRAGTWVSEDTPLFALLESEKNSIVAYMVEEELPHLQIGQRATFFPESGGRNPLQAEVAEIEQIGIDHLDSLYPASLFGGGLAVRRTPDDQLKPLVGAHRMRLFTLEPVDVERVIRGDLVVNGPERSLAERFWRQLKVLLIRESGF